MATLKHIASKNSDYTAIEAYLVYQHDAFTGKQLLDEQGRPKLRESYILDTLECGDFSFATACLLANRKYGKNTQRDDIKSHQYIISFDPRDAADNGLTMEKAQALGLKFCEENFSGHPAIVCTHPDGHNHSGNIHVHIVIGSIRTREVERKPYMQKPRDWLEGMKHSSTAQTMRHLRVEVMELCESAGLYLGFAFGVCLQCGKHCRLIELVPEMFRSDKLGSASGQIAQTPTAFLDGDAILLHKSIGKLFKTRCAVQHRRNL